MILRVLLATNKPALQGRIRQLLGDADVVLDTVKGARGLWEQIRRESYDLLLIGRALLSDSPDELVASVRGLPEPPEVVVLSSREDENDRALLQTAGCLSVVHLGLSNEMLRRTLESLLDRLRGSAGGLAAAESKIVPKLSNFVSDSPSMAAFMKVVRRVTGSDTSLLITGETGVGKEWLARAIHAEGPRRRGPLVALNCGAITETLLESELFGHEEGAFTGATRARRGMFELAHGGTIFLDEIGEMPLHLQVKLLRVLQHKEVHRLGAETTIRVDVRIMAATNQDLQDAVEQRLFRRDLYYRLGVVTLEIPPLRERVEDIPPLVENYIEYYGSQMHNDVSGISPEALDALVEYGWPGNVRELMNVIERAMLLCEGDEIGLIDLPESIGGIAIRGLHMRPLAAPAGPEGWNGLCYREARDQMLTQFEREYFDRLLVRARGRVGDAAEMAGIDPRSMYNKMKRLGLQKEDYRGSSGPDGGET